MSNPGAVTIQQIRSVAGPIAAAVRMPLTQTDELADQLADELTGRVWQEVAPASAVKAWRDILGADPAPEDAAWIDDGTPETADARALTAAIRGVLRQMLRDAAEAVRYAQPEA